MFELYSFHLFTKRERCFFGVQANNGRFRGMCVCVYVCMCMHEWVLCACMHASVRAYMHASVRACMHVCVFACMHCELNGSAHWINGQQLEFTGKCYIL